MPEGSHYTEPAEFFSIIDKSKVQYEIRSKPVDHPVKPETCERRLSETRVVEDSKGRHLEPWQAKPDAKSHFDKAEEAFREKKPDEAAKEYAACLAIDPGYAPAWLFSGDVPFDRGDYATALADYRKAIELDPTNAQGHRFAADALRRLQRWPEAEDEYIRALARDPGYKEAWEALERLGKQVGFKVERHPFRPPADSLGELADNKIQIRIDSDNPNSIGWLAYFSCKAVWRAESAYREKHGGEKARHSWSTNEEEECIFNYAYGTWNGVEGKLSDEAKKTTPAGPEPSEEQIRALLPEDVRFLLGVMKADMLWQYVVVEELGQRCPRPIALFPTKSFEEIEDYIRRFVIVRPGPMGLGKAG